MMTLSGEAVFLSITAVGGSIDRCCDHAPKILSELPTPSNISACDIQLPQPNVLYGVWIAWVVFDSSNSFILLQFPGLRSSNN